MSTEECKALLDALGKAAACYRHLVLTVGGAADSQELRQELRQTRRKARELAGAARGKLTAALREKGAGREARAERERLWVLFSACLELLEADMRRALELGREFPLQVPKKPLIQTGLTGGTSAVAARALSAQTVKYEAEGPVDVADLHDLEEEVRQVGEMLHEMEMKVSVPQWAVQARQEPGAELRSAASAGASSSLGMISVDGESKAFCDVSKALAGIIFTAVLLVAVILAVCVAKLS